MTAEKRLKNLEKSTPPCAAKALARGLDGQLPVAESARDELLKLGPVAAGPLTEVLEDSAFSEPARSKIHHRGF